MGYWWCIWFAVGLYTLFHVAITSANASEFPHPYFSGGHTYEDESYAEELIVSPLPKKLASAMRSVGGYYQPKPLPMVILGSTKRKFKGYSYNLFPRSMGDIVTRFGVERLHISFTQGRWDMENWGYAPTSTSPAYRDSTNNDNSNSNNNNESPPSTPASSSPIGIAIAVSFLPLVNITERQTKGKHYKNGHIENIDDLSSLQQYHSLLQLKEENRRWPALLSAVGGLFCSALSSADPDVNSIGEQWSGRGGYLASIPQHVYATFPNINGNSTNNNSTTRYHYLVIGAGQERVCLENLTPFLKLLPCTQCNIDTSSNSNKNDNRKKNKVKVACGLSSLLTKPHTSQLFDKEKHFSSFSAIFTSSSYNYDGNNNNNNNNNKNRVGGSKRKWDLTLTVTSVQETPEYPGTIQGFLGLPITSPTTIHPCPVATISRIYITLPNTHSLLQSYDLPVYDSIPFPPLPVYKYKDSDDDSIEGVRMYSSTDGVSIDNDGDDNNDNIRNEHYYILEGKVANEGKSKAQRIVFTLKPTAPLLGSRSTVVGLEYNELDIQSQLVGGGKQGGVMVFRIWKDSETGNTASKSCESGISNNFNNITLRVLFSQPKYLRYYLHGMMVELENQNGEILNIPCRINDEHTDDIDLVFDHPSVLDIRSYVPMMSSPLHKDSNASFADSSAISNISTTTSITISIPFSQKFHHFSHYPPDANHGREMGQVQMLLVIPPYYPAVDSTVNGKNNDNNVDNNDGNNVPLPINTPLWMIWSQWRIWRAQNKIINSSYPDLSTILEESHTIWFSLPPTSRTAPLPDFSMMYNVIGLTSTVIALYYTRMLYALVQDIGAVWEGIDGEGGGRLFKSQRPLNRIVTWIKERITKIKGTILGKKEKNE